jgi:hypothetical protein
LSWVENQKRISRRLAMIAKFQVSRVSLAVAAAFLAAAPSVLAQDIDFVCYGNASGPTSQVLLKSTGSTNQCMSNAVLGPLDKAFNVNGGNPLEWANEGLYHPSGYGVPESVDNQQFSSYTNPTVGGVNVTDASAGMVMFEDYNNNQGNQLPSLTSQQPPPSVPALGFGNEANGNISTPKTGTIIVTEGNGSTPDNFFTFNAVDLIQKAAVLAGTTYSIVGYDNPTNLALTVTPGSEGVAPADSIAGLTPVFSMICNANCLTTNSTTYTKISSTSTAGVDELVISIYNYGLTDLDNIQLPEGGDGFMYLLLAAGACGGALFMKRRVAA